MRLLELMLSVEEMVLLTMGRLMLVKPLAPEEGNSGKSRRGDDFKIFFLPDLVKPIQITTIEYFKNVERLPHFH